MLTIVNTVRQIGMLAHTDAHATQSAGHRHKQERGRLASVALCGAGRRRLVGRSAWLASRRAWEAADAARQLPSSSPVAAPAPTSESGHVSTQRKCQTGGLR